MSSLTTLQFSLKSRRVFVAGHRGMVGSAIVRRLQRESCEILTVKRDEVDLRRQADVESWFAANKPDVVVLAAATVGGILANDTRPAEFIYDNMAIQNAVIEAAHRFEVSKLLFLGSSCIYPKFADQPINESQLLTGPLEETNQWYAIAKIAGVKMCQAYRRQYGSDFVSVMPTNLYGPGDNFDLQGSHVIPALILKAHRAKIEGLKSFPVWGSGRPKREFLHVDDLADACVHVLQSYSGESHLNVGTGEDIAIGDLAKLVAKVVGFNGEIDLDPTKPDGTPRKLLDVGLLADAGWKASISLEKGLTEVYAWFLKGLADGSIRGV